ncbi:MAG: hypothetical protein ACRDU8_00390 [Egibacteraceae bacterium]
MLPACADVATADASDLPAWLNRVYPATGAETTTTRAVQVHHNTTSPRERIRVRRDSTDVTTHARQVVVCWNTTSTRPPPRSNRSLARTARSSNTSAPAEVDGIADATKYEALDRYAGPFKVP